METLPEGTLIKIAMEVRLPVAATEDQVEEWVHYSVGHTGGCALDNPLVHHDAQAWGSYGAFYWENTNYIGIREEFDSEEHADGSRTYRVRYRKERRV